MANIFANLAKKAADDVAFTKAVSTIAIFMGSIEAFGKAIVASRRERNARLITAETAILDVPIIVADSMAGIVFIVVFPYFSYGIS